MNDIEKDSKIQQKKFYRNIFLAAFIIFIFLLFLMIFIGQRISVNNKLKNTETSNVINVDMFYECNFSFNGFNEYGTIQHTCEQFSQEKLSDEQLKVINNIEYIFDKKNYLSNDEKVLLSLKYDEEALTENNLSLKENKLLIDVNNLEAIYDKISKIPNESILKIDNKIAEVIKEKETYIKEHEICTDFNDIDCSISSVLLIDKILSTNEETTKEDFKNRISYIYKISGQTFRDTSMIVKNPGLWIYRDIYVSVNIDNLSEKTDLEHLDINFETIKVLTNEDRETYQTESILREYRTDTKLEKHESFIK